LWLTDKIYRHGRRFSRDELLLQTTGKALDPSHYINTLQRKYGELYGV